MPPGEDIGWSPLTPDQVLTLFAQAGFPWWIAGGYAIDQFVGRQVRSHADIDVLALHRDHLALRRHLSDWDCWAADPPGQLKPWAIGEQLSPDVPDIWCRSHPNAEWSLQLMLDQAEGENWVSRRCDQVQRQLATLGVGPSNRFLSPEVQLFYKAKAPRHKDVLDFEAALPLLQPVQVNWLRDEITTAYGPANPWLARLRPA